MRIFLIALATISLLSTTSGQEQRNDSCSNLKRALKQQILPAGMLTAAVILNSGEMKKRVQNFFPDTETSVDDWLKNIPEIQMYTFDLMGFKHKNDVFDQTKYLLISHGVTGAIVQAMKETIHMKRPSGGLHSFPSGHTSYAFVGATALYHEFHETQPLLAYSGFVFATATGVLRITNNAHWFPDVLAGAAVGVLVTNLVYQAAPGKRIKLPSIKSHAEINSGISKDGICVIISF
jgi:hypothetical protein